MSFGLKTIFVWFSAVISFSGFAFAQEASIELGKKDIALNELFTITLTIRNAQVKNTHSAFPDISGMQKREVALVNTKEVIDGRSVIIQRITQNYLAQKTGTYRLLPFRMTVNGEVIASLGMTIQVLPAGNENDKPGAALSDKLYEEILDMEKELAEVKEDAFLSFSASKDTVYAGEGFTATLALYVAESNQVEMKSFEEGAQLVEILKKLKPASCWEQDYNIREFHTSSITLNKKRYTQYKMYQANYFPLSADTIRFPSVGFKMVRYRTIRNPQTTHTSQQADTVAFFSKPRTVCVKELPAHPLKGGIAVGNYNLQEAISRSKLMTGQSFIYEYRISGEGNLATVNLAVPFSNPAFDFYPPEIRLSQDRQNLMRGAKTFRFTGVPKESGTYPLQPYFEWIYFNSENREYDTLRPRTMVEVSGESFLNYRLSAIEMKGIYRDMNGESNRLRSVNSREVVRNLINGLLLTLLLAAMLLMVVKK